MTDRDPVEKTLHTFLWDEGLRVSERTEQCTGQDARALAEALTPVVRGLMADAVRKAAFTDLSVGRFAAEEALPECHKAKCHLHHPSADEIVSLVWKRLRDTMIEQSIFVRHPDDEEDDNA